MFSKLRYPKILVDSNINNSGQEPDKEIHPVPSADRSVYMVLPSKDQCTQGLIYSLGAEINVNVEPVLRSKKLSQTLSVNRVRRK